MISRFAMILSLVMAAGAILVSEGAMADVKSTAVTPEVMAKINPDNDGTVDLAEAKKAGAAMFEQLDPDDDGTLDLNELSGRITKDEFEAANPDNDGTLDLEEYMALIEKYFKAANPDNDGTLDEAELKTPEGQKLLALIV